MGPSEEQQRQWEWAAGFNKKLRNYFGKGPVGQDPDEEDRNKRRAAAARGVTVLGPM